MIIKESMMNLAIIFLQFNWTTDTTYKFILRAEPIYFPKSVMNPITNKITSVKANGTKFTAWFGDPNNKTAGGWRLIATWMHPNVYTYLAGLNSFMQSYMSDQGNVTKKVYFGNQWAYNTSNKWTEITKVKMTDEKAILTKRRRDLDGGLYQGNQFFYQQNGFFDCPLYGSKIVTRTANKKPPNVTLTSLP